MYHSSTKDACHLYFLDEIEDEIIMPCNSSIAMEISDTCLPVMIPVQMQDNATLASYHLTYQNPDCLPNSKPFWKANDGRSVPDNTRDCSTAGPCVNEPESDGMY